MRRCHGYGCPDVYGQAQVMKMFWVAFICFTLGSYYGRWDAKQGAEWGYKAGRWTRIHILGLPPVENDRMDR